MLTAKMLCCAQAVIVSCTCMCEAWSACHQGCIMKQIALTLADLSTAQPETILIHGTKLFKLDVMISTQ